MDSNKLFEKIALSPNYDEVDALFEVMSNEVGNVKNEVRGVESLEARQGICNYLDDKRALMGRMRKNTISRIHGKSVVTDDNI